MNYDICDSFENKKKPSSYLLETNEVKKLMINEGEDMNNFIIKNKIDLTKEKNENIKNMKRLILKHPDIFVKTSIVSRELKKNIEENEHIFDDIKKCYEYMKGIFESDEFVEYVKELKYVCDNKNVDNIHIDDNNNNNVDNIHLDDNNNNNVDVIHIDHKIEFFYDNINNSSDSNDFLNNIRFILYIPFMLYKNNEKNNFKVCMEYIKMSIYINMFLNKYYKYMNNKNIDLLNYLKSYQKSVMKHVEKIKENIYNVIMKCDSIETLKECLLYICVVYDYYKLYKEKDDDIDSIKNVEINVDKKNVLNNNMCDYKNIYVNDKKYNIKTTEYNNEYIKNTFLMIKHYNIIISAKEYIEKHTNNMNDYINLYDIINFFQTQISKLKNIYELIFSDMDNYLYKHIIYIYYFCFCLINIKIKNNNFVTLDAFHSMKKNDLYILNKMNQHVLNNKKSNDHINNYYNDHINNYYNDHDLLHSEDYMQNIKNISYGCQSGEQNFFFNTSGLVQTKDENVEVKENKNENINNINNINNIYNIYNIYMPNNKINEQKSCNTFHADIPFNNIKYPFVNINSCIFNYMHYHVILKESKEINGIDLISDTYECDEEGANNNKKYIYSNINKSSNHYSKDEHANNVSKKKKKKKSNTSYLDYHINEKSNMFGTYSYENKDVLKNHNNFINILYEEERKKKKKIKKANYNNEENHYRCKYNEIKKKCLNEYISIQNIISNYKIKESILNLFEYRKKVEKNKSYESKIYEQLDVSIIFPNILNKLFLVYINNFLQKNNFFFLQNVLLLFSDIQTKIQNKKTTINDTKQIINILYEHIKDEKNRLNHIYHDDFFSFINFNKLNQEKQNNIKINIDIFKDNIYMEKISTYYKYPFLITYFYNLLFLLKNIKCYIDKSLSYIIINLFEYSYKHLIHTIILIFIRNQNIFFTSSVLQYILQFFFLLIFPFSFYFLSCIFKSDFTSTTEKIFKVLSSYGTSI
ncbi:hypothetical protein PGSY75_0608900 [Plasmodium gaboni]|uniref:Uncharacterized protein n=1 Tax=Plasmodium gaboni TaxID=647221 RepID=A0A151LRG2_9APIC|nr:hypothetical protein PGSY75_0608900 [Plasmodium gaboni]KYO01786.1 hypothetical protein PGSY75_0608900 [Plasmodium gaboni]